MKDHRSCRARKKAAAKSVPRTEFLTNKNCEELRRKYRILLQSALFGLSVAAPRARECRLFHPPPNPLLLDRSIPLLLYRRTDRDRDRHFREGAPARPPLIGRLTPQKRPRSE